MNTLNIPTELLILLNSDHFEHFTAMELRDAYLEQGDHEEEDGKKVRQFIYRNIIKLEREGFLERLESAGNGKPRYQVTQRLKALYYEDNIGKPSNSAELDGVTRSLQDKLHQYRVEMLTAIGEAEEYDAICRELPQIRGEIQDLYDQARDRCSKTLGRVRALEIIISNHLNH
ncbi:hypothetical protein [Sedimenticola selenatireducens]|uniref:hypothetical protein n=1 Tax=Sedimenticola selenatireducens TaxID=191960 RepID=UPI002AAAB1B8|nr:hypothetical protein [Sedimenticola selenatireducens]